jgi:hypothetical protein
MAEAVQSRPNPDHSPSQSSASLAVIQNAQRRPVCNQDVRVYRYCRVESFAVGFSAQPEGSAVQRSCRTAPDAKPFDLDSLIQEESCVAQAPTPLLRFGLDGELVVASRAYAVLGRLLPKPLVEVIDLRRRLGEKREVPAMDQYVAGWDLDLPVQLMRIGDDDYFNERLLL